MNQLKIAVVCIVDPYGNNDGGRIRTQSLIRAMRQLGHDVTCYAASAPDGDPAPGVRYFESGNVGSRGPMQRFGPMKRKYLPVGTSMGAACPDLSGALRGAAPFDVFVATDLPCWRFLADSEAARGWLDFSDVTSEVAERYASTAKAMYALTARMQASWVRRNERKACKEAAIVTTAGSADADVVRSFAPAAVWLPTPVNLPRLPLPMNGVAPAKVAGFLANLDFAPNRDAYELLDTVWAPRLEALGWRVVVGGYGSSKLRPTSSIEILGVVDSLEDFYAQIACSLAPLRMGGGIKVKAIEALVAGRPVIATEHVAHGFPTEFRDALVVVDPVNPDLERAVENLPFGDQFPDMSRFTYSAFDETVDQLLA